VYEVAVQTVSQLTRYLREVLTGDPFLGDLWVTGAASNCTTSQAGHTYFTLKDADAQVRCVMFKGGQGSEHVQNGTALIVHGHVSIYEARGALQVVTDMAVPEGVGVLQAQFEALKKRLEEEGLFEPTRKRPLPEFPRVIGVVTSPTGAVLHDICHVLERRYPLVKVLLAPTPVQGDEAAQGIVSALEALNRRDDVDSIILARGGGSLEELWPFNEEMVAHAIFASRIPIATGVGHETDFTIADYVADVRAPTPSAAAEIAVPDVTVLQEQVGSQALYLHQLLSGLVIELRHTLASSQQRLRFLTPNIEEYRRRVDDLAQATHRGLQQHLSLLHERSEGLKRRLEALEPQDTLRRGYAIVQRATDEAIISRVGQARDGESLRITVSNGDFPATTGGKKRPKRNKKKVDSYAGKPLF
jgi:exodeoxyribonuclease VII large subunit